MMNERAWGWRVYGSGNQRHFRRQARGREFHSFCPSWIKIRPLYTYRLVKRAERSWSLGMRSRPPNRSVAIAASRIEEAVTQAGLGRPSIDSQTTEYRYRVQRLCTPPTSWPSATVGPRTARPYDTSDSSAAEVSSVAGWMGKWREVFPLDSE